MSIRGVLMRAGMSTGFRAVNNALKGRLWFGWLEAGG